MTISSPSLDLFNLPATEGVGRPNNLSSHEKAQWDSTGFESWFNSAMHRFWHADSLEQVDVAISSPNGKTEARSSQSSASSVEAKKLSAIHFCPDPVSGVRQAVAASIKSESISFSQIALSLMFMESPVGGEESTRVTEAMASRVSVPVNSADKTGGKITAALSDDAVSVWVQDAQLSGRSLSGLRDAIAKELIRSGLALAGLKVNGHDVVRASAFPEKSDRLASHGRYVDAINQED